MSYSLFAYGTLMTEEVMSLVIGRTSTHSPATLAGYRRGQLRGEVYPAIRPAPEHRVGGVLYTDLSPADIRQLDLFEGEMYQRQAIPVELADGRLASAETYVLRAEFYHQLTDNPWSLQEFMDQGRELFVADYAGVGRLRNGRNP